MYKLENGAVAPEHEVIANAIKYDGATFGATFKEAKAYYKFRSVYRSDISFRRWKQDEDGLRRVDRKKLAQDHDTRKSMRAILIAKSQ